MIETERKFQIDQSDAEKIVSLVPSLGYGAGTPMTKSYHDLYADTSDFRLLAGGRLYRLRDMKTELIGTFKEEVDGVYKRKEIEAPVDRNDAETFLSADLGKLDIPPVRAVRRVLGKAAISEVCGLTNNRTKILIGKGAAVIELAIDRVEYDTGDKFYGLELELKRGIEHDMDIAAKVLEEILPLKKENMSKYERGVHFSRRGNYRS